MPNGWAYDITHLRRIFMKLMKLFATFCVGLFITTLLALPVQAGSHSKKLKIALLPGVIDPFYLQCIVVQNTLQKALGWN